MSDQWEDVKRLFAAALECEAGERSAFLHRACGHDAELHKEVEALLASRDRADSLLEDSPVSTATSTPTDLLPGTQFGSYRLAREIGAGGMARVYLAERADREYRKLVAIKVVKRETGNGGEIMRRFRSERQTLAALDHPNIVKLLDGGSTQDGLPYLVMEYVEGTRLDEYADHHKLSTTERLQLFRSVCAGVHYAHQVGVIHRDLKPSNILVTEPGVPKLLDFGIAKLLNPNLTGRTLVVTRPDARPMTLEYASPEQIRGDPLAAASDVYSLGVVLYELLTGHRPYRLKHVTPLELEHAICEVEPERPSTIVTHDEQTFLADGTTVSTITPGAISSTREGNPEKLRRRLHGDLDNIVLMALRKEPQRRYSSVEEFSEDIRRHLENLPIKARRNTPVYRTAKLIHRHREAALASLLLLAFVVGTSIWETRRAAEPGRNELGQGQQRLEPRRSVAVLGVKNLSGSSEKSWLSTALAEMLTTELAAGNSLRTIPGENIVRAKTELSLSDADALGRETLLQMRRKLGADLIVLGSFVDLGDQAGGKIRLDLRLQDLSAGETIAAVSETGTELDLFDLVSRTGTQLRHNLGVSEVTSQQAVAIRASIPVSPEAARFYSEGLARLRLFDALSARDLLQKAIATEPSHALAHSALADAWSYLGWDRPARDEAKRAFELSSNLSRESQLLIEASYHETTREWDRATEIYRALISFFPDNLEYGLRLAAVQTQAGKGKDALATVQELRKPRQPAHDDPRIDLAESVAAFSISDFKRQQAAAARAVDKGTATNAPLIVARGRLSEGSALMNLVELQAATKAFNDAKSKYAEAGDMAGVARALQNIGNVLKEQGDLDGCEKMYRLAQATYQNMGNERGVAAIVGNLANVLTDRGEIPEAARMAQTSLEKYREIGDKQGTSNQLSNLAVILVRLGDVKEGMKSYEEALTINREIGNKRQIALALNNMGDLLYREGELGLAMQKFSEALAIRRELGNSKDVAIALANVSQVAFSRGNLSVARQLLEEALPLFRQSDSKSGAAYALLGLGQIAQAGDDFATARAQYQEALDIRNQLGEKGTVAEAQIALAQLSIEGGHPDDAVGRLRQAFAEFQKEKEIDNQIIAAATLATAFLAEGKLADATQAVEGVRPLDAKSQNHEAHLNLAIAAAKIHAALGKTVEAEGSLKNTVSDATEKGYLGYQLEAGLALAEIQMKSTAQPAVRQRLGALEHEAKTKGFGLIARKAAAARR